MNKDYPGRKSLSLVLLGNKEGMRDSIIGASGQQMNGDNVGQS